jgi:radical SAM superfamily enzyme YgiQ (UPF0313 family)
MFFNPVDYDEPIFRPPAEASSAILQVSLGCSWNKCAFCEMYTTKKFSVRELPLVKQDIKYLFDYYPKIRRFFLADGDAMTLPTNHLLEVIQEINLEALNCNTKLQRVSSYALPKNILSKSHDDLIKLRSLGLKLLYVGIETGDDELLKLIKKGETYDSTVLGLKMVHDAGIDTSVMIISGLGGKLYSKQHAENSARIINAINPKYLSVLTLSFPFGKEHFLNRFKGNYVQQTKRELFAELRDFISLLEVEGVIFRSNHVSNNISPAGTLSKDKNGILEMLDFAIRNTDENEMPQNPQHL